MYRSRTVGAIFLVTSLAFAASAQQNADEQAPFDPQPFVNKLIGGFKQLGNWDEHYAYEMDAIEKVYQRNGWDSESDQFSLELVRSVEEIPPWDPVQRFSKLTEVIGDRYLLDVPQYKQLQRLFIEESNHLFEKYGSQMVQTTLEVVQARAAGEPYTTEQVQRWSQAMAPMLEDMHGRINTMAERFIDDLDPEQRELVKRDLAAANRRLERVTEMSKEWQAGKWRPEDWGMENDPVQTGQVRRERASEGNDAKAPGAPEAGESGKPALSGQPPAQPANSPQKPSGAITGAQDNDPWAQYVRDFIRRFAFDESQQQRSWVIYRDARTRRDAMAARFDQQLEPLRRKAESDSGRQAIGQVEKQKSDALERVFDQLKHRLDRLPTRAQRKTAEAAPAKSDAGGNKPDSPSKP